MIIDCFEVILNNSSTKNYLAGDDVKGIIKLHVKEHTKIARLSIRVFGSIQTAWRNKLTDIFYESKKLILDKYIDITSCLFFYCNETTEVPKGEHNLPLDVISTVEKIDYGFIKYVCMAVLDIPQNGGSKIIAETEFRVVSYLNVDAPHFQQPTQEKEQVNVIGLCCKQPKGSIQAKVIVSKLGLLPGETAKVIIIIRNTVNKKKKSKKHKGIHQCALLSFCQQIDFTAQSRKDFSIYDNRSITTVLKSCGTCKASTSKGPEIKLIDFEIPSNLPPTSNNENNLIVCSYFFRLDMKHFDVIVPIVIGSQTTLKNF